MRIFVFGTRGFPTIQGGVEMHCERLYTSMPEDLDITVFRRKPFLPIQAPKRLNNIRFIDLISTRVKGFESFFHSFLSAVICAMKRPDIVHIHNIGPGLFTPLLKLVGIRVVLTYHSPNYEHKKWGKIARFILKSGETISLRLSDRIIFVNKFQREKFSEKILRKSVYLPNGITKVNNSNDTEYIKSLGLVPQKYILAVGRITQEKGFDYLIDAFAQLNLDYKLVIAGGIDYQQDYATSLLNKIEGKNVLMPGYVYGEQLRQLYSHAKLFVLPSYNEGFPLVLLEAMNYNLSIIASDILANKQLKLPENSFFKTGDIESLKDAIIDKINISEENTYDLTDYNWKDIALKVVDIYNQTGKYH